MKISKFGEIQNKLKANFWFF